MSERDHDQVPEPKPDHLDYAWLAKALPVAVIIALFIVFAVQNSERVEVEFLAWAFETPQIVLLAIAAVAGAVLWEFARAMRRRRRRRSGQG